MPNFSTGLFTTAVLEVAALGKETVDGASLGRKKGVPLAGVDSAVSDVMAVEAILEAEIGATAAASVSSLNDVVLRSARLSSRSMCVRHFWQYMADTICGCLGGGSIGIMRPRFESMRKTLER